MKIRRYKGTKREELYRMIHKEMGPDAVVVVPESSGQGLLGRSRKLELIAILDDTAPASNADSSVDNSASDQASKQAQADKLKQSQVALTQDFRRWSRQQNHKWKNLQETVEDIQKTVETLQAIRPETPPIDNDDDKPDYAKAWDTRFCAWARKEQQGALSANPRIAQGELTDILPIADDFAFNNPRQKPHIVVMIGPTGSGKTTTLAKMAAICGNQDHLRVGLITIDTYRIAAVDQIREYASLLDMKLRVAFSVEDVKAAVQEMHDMDVVFVDTPGRTHFDEIGLAVSQKLLHGLGSITPLLTIPATMNPGDLPDVMSGFARFKPHYLVVTKIDETRQPTLFTYLPFETDLQVAFITNGQRVPQDIVAGGSDKVASLLVSPPAQKDQASAPSRQHSGPDHKPQQSPSPEPE